MYQSLQMVDAVKNYLTKALLYFLAGVAQLVEHQPSKLRVASSNLVARSTRKLKIGK